MSEQLTLIEEAFGLTVVEGENLQLTLDGGNGPAGPAGPAGPSGSGSITTSSTTNLTGYIFGNGSNIAGATAAASDNIPSTLVRRTANGDASFSAVEVSTLTAAGISSNGLVSFNGEDAGDSLTFNMVNYYYGTGAAEAHRTALGSQATGDQLFTAATPAAARTILEINRTRVTQAADLSNATTTFVDTDLVLTLQGGVDYLIRGQFDFVSTAGTTGWKLQLLTSQNVNALATTANSLGWVALGGTVAPINLATLTTAEFANFTGSSTRRAQAEIRINLVATGTARIRFAQNGGNTAPASVFKAGSFWTSERL